MADTTESLTRERIEQLMRAGLPFNVVSGQEMVGNNLERLRRSMSAFGWRDPRFVTLAEAQNQGWKVADGSQSVEIVQRDPSSGAVQNVSLYNASTIIGMPSILEMLAKSENDLSHVDEAGTLAADGDEIAIAPARAIVRDSDMVHKASTRTTQFADDAHYRIIEASYNDMLAVPNHVLTVEDVRESVTEDIAALRNIANQDDRYFAAVTIGDMTESQKAYKQELTRQAPEILAEVNAALAENRRRVTDKEDRKLADMSRLGIGVPQQPLILQPGYNKLVEHGAAPFEHDPQKSGSYFAVLENAEGEKTTVWGVDIERSLAEAAVSIGDAISLTRGGKEKVSIKERQADGSIAEKVVDRFKWHTKRQPVVQEQIQTQAGSLGDGPSTETEVPVTENGYAVLAPYWVDGLHNAEGVALAEEINKAIKDQKIAKDKEAIERLMAVYPRASDLSVQVVTYERYRDDPHLTANSAQPRSLLDGALVRDKEGAYRPAAGGRPVLLDQGDAVLLKTKEPNGYQAAMELAIAKGWTAIELKGKPAMLAEAWLEAKLKGLDVVNYVPNEKDKAKYTERVAQESARRQVETSTTEQSPEMVEVRPFTDADGKQKEAHITYTVEAQGIKPQSFENAMGAAQAFSRAPAASRPSVLRTVTRIDGGVVRPDTIAGTTIEMGKPPFKFVDDKLDQEFAEAITQINEEERALSSLSALTTGTHIGPIVKVEGNMIAQKTGRDPTQIAWHDVSKLNGVTPKLGDMAEISYSKGVGKVKAEPEKGRELAGANGGLAR